LHFLTYARTANGVVLNLLVQKFRVDDVVVVELDLRFGIDLDGAGNCVPEACVAAVARVLMLRTIYST